MLEEEQRVGNGSGGASLDEQALGPKAVFVLHEREASDVQRAHRGRR